MASTPSNLPEAYFQHLTRLLWLRSIFHNKLTSNKLFGAHFFCFLVRAYCVSRNIHEVSIMYVSVKYYVISFDADLHRNQIL